MQLSPYNKIIVSKLKSIAGNQKNLLFLLLKNCLPLSRWLRRKMCCSMVDVSFGNAKGFQTLLDRAQKCSIERRTIVTFNYEAGTYVRQLDLTFVVLALGESESLQLRLALGAPQSLITWLQTRPQLSGRTFARVLHSTNIIDALLYTCSFVSI